MKKLGLMCTILGGVSFLVTLILRGGENYKAATVVSTIGSAFGISGGDASSYKTNVDIFFYLGIAALIVGIVLLIVNKPIAVTNQSGAIEADDISKNEQISISENQILGLTILVLGIAGVAYSFSKEEVIITLSLFSAIFALAGTMMLIISSNFK